MPCKGHSVASVALRKSKTNVVRSGLCAFSAASVSVICGRSKRSRMALPRTLDCVSCAVVSAGKTAGLAPRSSGRPDKAQPCVPFSSVAICPSKPARRILMAPIMPRVRPAHVMISGVSGAIGAASIRWANSPFGMQTECGTRIFACSVSGRASKTVAAVLSVSVATASAFKVLGCQTCSASSPRIFDGTLTPLKTGKPAAIHAGTPPCRTQTSLYPIALRCPAARSATPSALSHRIIWSERRGTSWAIFSSSTL